MSRSEIITTAKEFRDTPLGQYQFPPETGSFVGILVYRAWHPSNKPCLICCFDTDNGEHFKLYAWWDKSYSPRNSLIRFADDVMNGSRWKCEYKRAPRGSITWLTAEPLSSN